MIRRVKRNCGGCFGTSNGRRSVVTKTEVTRLVTTYQIGALAATFAANEWWEDHLALLHFLESSNTTSLIASDVASAGH